VHSLKRGVDLLISVLSLPLVLVVMTVAVVCIVVDDPGTPFHASTRVGRDGRPFRLLKLRSLRLGAERKAAITVKADLRLTRVGTALRRYRIDELPQLLNVLRGEMSFVGPRPEDPRFVSGYSESDRIVLRVPPGIAGLAQLEFHDEVERLDPTDPEGSYRREILPRKLAIDRAYVARASTPLDLAILWNTALLVLFGKDPAPFVERVLRPDGEPPDLRML